jgi:hypothetical protein
LLSAAAEIAVTQWWQDRGFAAMKKLIALFVLGSLVFVYGCSDDGKSPAPVPTPVTETWSVTGLTVSSSSAQVNSVILATATVTKDGSPAPDGTAVEFLASGGYFISSAGTSAEVATAGGSAVVQFYATDSGSYTIQARVVDSYRQVTVSYYHPSQSDLLQVYGISPTEGPSTGGQLAYITGRNIKAPAEAYFVVGGAAFQATTVDVSTTGDSMTVRTPEITGVDQAQEWTANLRIDTRVGLGDGESYTLASSYRFGPLISDPIIYILQPNHGSARGGETINIIGQSFIAPVRVTLGSLEVGEETVSPDGQMISFLTPEYSATQTNADVTVDVTVYSESGTARQKTVTKTQAFTFEADIKTPVITGIDPVAGPLDGGTVVSIFGSGFSIPVQVFFGTKVAVTTDVRENRIVCVSPDYSTVPNVTPPVSVNVSVTNVSTGLSSAEMATFTYGENLFISGNSPTEGGLGSVVTIYGSGFEDPTLVDFTGVSPDLRLETIAVSGTELIVRFPNIVPGITCGGGTGSFNVTLIDSGLTVSGGRFTLLGDQPQCYNVQPAIVPEGGATVTVYGNNFSDDVGVAVDDVQLGQSQIERTDDQTLTVILPSANDLGLVWPITTCTTTAGLAGVRYGPLVVALDIFNLPSMCECSLNLTYEPLDTTCIPVPVLGYTPDVLTFPPTPVGGTYNLQVNLENIGSGTLRVTSIQTPAGFQATPLPPFDLVSGAGPMILTVTFAPTQDGASYSGTINIRNVDASDNSVLTPGAITVSGDEAEPLITTSPYSPGSTYTFATEVQNGSCSPIGDLFSLTVSNTGYELSAITIDPVSGLTGPFNITTAPVAINPGESTVVEVEYCPVSNTNGNEFGTLTIACDDNANCPITIDLVGTEAAP